MDMTAETQLALRTKRFMDAIELKKPDRVPTFVIQELFPARYAGITYQEAFYDLDKWLAANEKTVLDFAPDMYFFLAAGVMTPGKVGEILGYHQHKWPGNGLGPDVAFQFVEGEYMKADEYDHFLSDPTDFLIRVYLPRTNSALQGLSLLPPLQSLIMGAAGLTPLLLAPSIAGALTALTQAAPEMARWSGAYGGFYKKMADCGFPVMAEALSLAPYDMISDFLRGMRGTMLDMYRCPDKLKAAMERILPLMIGTAVGMAQMSGNPRVFIPLHRGADGFMSISQFEEFYWPTLKALIVTLADAGLVPIPFFEGVYDQRMHYLRELPTGKVLAWFDRSDLFKVKEVIGDVIAFAGGMPVSMLVAGTPEEVREHTRHMIQSVGQDGGYIMTSSTALDDARPELVKAWLDATLEFGVYS
jgi:hypothetical protein